MPCGAGPVPGLCVAYAALPGTAAPVPIDAAAEASMLHAPKPDNSNRESFWGAAWLLLSSQKLFPVIRRCFVSRVCSEVGQKASTPS